MPFYQILGDLAVSKNILLVSPENPDPDSVECLLSFRRFLQWYAEKHKTELVIHLFAPTPVFPNSVYAVTEDLGDPCADILTEIPQVKFDLCVLFDYARFSRAGLESLINSGVMFVGFDHHKPEDELPPDSIAVIDIDAPSTTAILVQFFQYAGFPIDPLTATSLLIGILTDTGKLTNPLTSPDALEIAAKLFRKGGKFLEIMALMKGRVTLAGFQAQQKIRERIEIDTQTGIGFFWFSQKDLREFGATQAEVLAILGILQNTEGINVATAYYELPNGEWQCSLRSNLVNGKPILPIAEKLGGGGHETSAGFKINDRPDTVFERIIKTVAELNFSGK